MRYLAHAAAALVGAAVGVAGLALHRSLIGLLLVVVVTLGVAGVLRLWPHRLTASFCAGWLVVVLGAYLGRPEGDYAIATDLFGWSLIGVAMAVVAVGVASLTGRDSGSRGRPT